MSDKPKPELRLAELRDRINAIDLDTIDRLNERLAVAREIGQLKAGAGKKVLDTRREFDVLTRLIAANTRGDLDDIDLLQIYKGVVTAARGLQQQGEAHVDPPSLFAVFGHPIGHSLSPLMHNAAFWATGFNANYFAVDAKEPGQIIAGMRALSIRGASVTIPHKTAVLSQLDALDPQAAKIGAVNTIVNEDGRLIGYNTDFDGLLRALKSKTDVADLDVVIVGAGGAARAAAGGILSAGGRVMICSRTPDSGESLAAELNCEHRPLEKLPKLKADILIHATPVGMSPKEGVSVVPADMLRSGMLVMDMVYAPIRTQLLQDASAAGCETIDGSEMFVHQGARQFELWTGLEAPVDIMRLFVHAALKQKY